MVSVQSQLNNAALHQRHSTRYLFLMFLSLFWLTNSGFDTSEAGNHYLVAKQIITNGTLGFDQSIEGIFTVAPNRWIYGSHEIGNTLFLLPTAGINQFISNLLTHRGWSPDRVDKVEQLVVSFQAGFYMSLTLLYLFLILREEYNHSVREASLECLLLATCTFVWPFSRNLYDGVLCGLLLTAGIYYLLRYRRQGNLPNIAMSYCLLGLAVVTRLTMVIPATVGLGFIVVARPKTWLQGLLTAIGILIPFAIWQMWYNHLRTGNPFISPVQTPQYAVNNALDGSLWLGVTGLLFSPGKSVFLYAPLLLLSIVVYSDFWSRDWKVAFVIVVVGLLWLLLHAKLRSWYGAWGWGPRHFITLLPLLALPGLVHLPSLWRNPHRRWLVIGIAMLGFVVAVSSMIGNWHYRMSCRDEQGTLNDDSFVWSVTESQPVDMVRASVNNLGVVLSLSKPYHVKDASYLNNYASNRINMWWYTMAHAGIPLPILLVAVGVLLSGLFYSAAVLYRRAPN